MIRIEDVEDERIADYRNVKDADLERRRELFLVEGLLVVRRLLEQSRFPVRSVLALENKLSHLSDHLSKFEGILDVYVAQTEVLDEIVGFSFHRGIIALGERIPDPPLETLLLDTTRVIVLEGLTNPENVGSVFRNAAGLGVHVGLLDPSCADPLYRMATRVSIGTTLSLPWTRAKNWSEELLQLKNRGFVLAALSPAENAQDLSSLAKVPEKVAVVVGNEGNGLSTETLEACDLLLKIPMHSGVDSLNVATAAAIGLFALSPSS